MHIKTIDGASSSDVAQTLQSRPNQGGPAVSLIQETKVRFDAAIVVSGPVFDRGDLAVDRPTGSLVFRGNPGI
jgi:hypothetical protein